MNGTAHGIITFRRRSPSDAPKLTATFTSCWSTNRMPAIVFMVTGKTTSRKMITTLDASPMPNQMMKSGVSATSGVVYRADSQGSR